MPSPITEKHIIVHSTIDYPESYVNKWLRSKTDKELPLYDTVLPPKYGKHMDISMFPRYYADPSKDQDMVNRDSSYDDLTLNTLDHSPSYPNDESFLHIYSYMDKFRSGVLKEEAADQWQTVTSKKGGNNTKVQYSTSTPSCDTINVLIPGNSNRFHANYLMKSMIDCADYHNMKYEILDSSSNNEVQLSLLDPTFKDEFYKFCFDNTYKQ